MTDPGWPAQPPLRTQAAGRGTSARRADWPSAQAAYIGALALTLPLWYWLGAARWPAWGRFAFLWAGYCAGASLGRFVLRRVRRWRKARGAS